MFTINLSDLKLKNREIDPELKKQSSQEILNLVDNETFLYDCFYRWDSLYCFSPPNSLYAWEKFFCQFNISDGSTLEKNVTLVLHKCNKVIIKLRVENILSNPFLEDIEIVKGRFPGRRKILYTMQKDNKLSWIREWVRKYRDLHFIDTVIIYDNKSTEYSCSDILNALCDLGIEIIVQNVPYKYGTTAKKKHEWKSNYLQHAMFEHVRYRFCNKDSILINSDIDEIIFTKSGLPIEAYLKNDVPFLLFNGHMFYVEKSNLISNNLKSYEDHNILEKKPYQFNKWIARLNLLPNDSMLKTHRIDGIEKPKISEDLFYGHYDSISNNWNNRKIGKITFNQNDHIENKACNFKFL